MGECGSVSVELQVTAQGKEHHRPHDRFVQCRSDFRMSWQIPVSRSPVPCRHLLDVLVRRRRDSRRPLKL